jgi:peptidoglycan/LPS O-acetylase OafA/YrhL
VEGAGKGSARISQLDGLRGIAILLVLALHFLSDSKHPPFGSFLYRFGAAFRLGWAGVDLFFVLSGFLIGGILFDARVAKNYFRVFYTRRLFRIVPIYYSWITLYVLVQVSAGAWLSHLIPADSSALRFVPLFYVFVQNYFEVPFGSLIWVWLTATWSLGVEEQFYLVAPPLIRFLSIKTLKTVLIATLFLAPILRVLVYFYAPDGHDAMYTWMPCRADSLAFGVLAAVMWREGAIRRWYDCHRRFFFISMAILGSAVPVFIKWKFDPHTLAMGAFGYTWLALFFTGLLLLCLLEPDGRWSSFLRMVFLREMGKLSYCMYIIHLAILNLSHRILLHSRPRIYDLPGAAVSLLALFLTYSIAKGSWIFFEHPLIRRGHSFTYR